MPLFRFHRGSLDDSMATAREYKSLQDLKAAIAQVWPSPGEEIALEFEYAGYDDRTGWDTYYVTEVRSDGRFIVGMSDGVF